MPDLWSRFNVLSSLNLSGLGRAPFLNFVRGTVEVRVGDGSLKFTDVGVWNIMDYTVDAQILAQSSFVFHVLQVLLDLPRGHGDVQCGSEILRTLHVRWKSYRACGLVTRHICCFGAACC